jgi:transposase
MSWLAIGCMATTPPCRSSPRARRRPAGSGSTCATIGRSAARILLRRCSTPRERHLAGYAGSLQADAFDGYNRLYLADRKPGPVVEALCWSHARRKFFELTDIAANARRGRNAPPISPIALEAVKRIDALFGIEREINGLSVEKRLAARRERSAPLAAALEGWMRAERAKLSRHVAVAKAVDYMLTRW